MFFSVYGVYKTVATEFCSTLQYCICVVQLQDNEFLLTTLTIGDNNIVLNAHESVLETETLLLMWNINISGSLPVISSLKYICIYTICYNAILILLQLFKSKHYTSTSKKWTNLLVVSLNIIRNNLLDVIESNCTLEGMLAERSKYLLSWSLLSGNASLSPV